MTLRKPRTARSVEPSTRKPAPDQVRDQLRRAILAGDYPAGAQLRQEELAERFGISRIPVREALRQLEVEGFVTLQPNRGAVVSSFSLSEIKELLEIRIALECRALKLAVPNMIESDLELAEDILKSYVASDRPQRWAELNWKFHEALYAPCNMPRLLGMIESHYGHLSLFARSQVSQASGKEIPHRQHYAILEACRKGDADKAVRLLEEHIVHTQKSLEAASRRTRLQTQR